MTWNLERIKHEIHVFAEHARETIGNIDGVKQLEDCPIEISSRMTRTKGCFHFSWKRRNGKIIGVKPVKIVIAKHLLERYNDEDIIGVIRHECVHHIVNIYTKGKHTGHGEIFKKYCRKLGISDERLFYGKPKEDIELKEQTQYLSTKQLPNRYVGKCIKCGHEYYRKQLRESTLKSWINDCYCHKCTGKLHIIDTKDEVVYVQGKGTKPRMLTKNKYEQEFAECINW